jgi:transposase
LAFSGIDIPEQYDNSSWSKNFLNWLKALDCGLASNRLSLNYQLAEVEFLRAELLKISNDIRSMMREQRYKVNYYLLRTIPGIGPLTAASILVEIGDINRFERFCHLNSFVGLLPMEHSSGEDENKGALTVRRHKQLRSDLVESAWTAKRIDPALSLYYAEQIKRKEHKVVVIKIARKLLSRIRYVLKTQKAYEKGVIK